MGAVANLRPDLFRAVVAEVPFVDCLTTMLDDTLPLTITEWEEWGDPVNDPELYALMKSYSPYDNVEAKAYPALLVTGGLNDPRVQYWEPAKWVAKLRTLKTDDHLLVLKMELGAGHSGPSGRYDAWRDEAFVQAFLLDQLGISADDRTMIERTVITTSDGLALEAERAPPDGRAACGDGAVPPAPAARRHDALDRDRRALRGAPAASA